MEKSTLANETSIYKLLTAYVTINSYVVDEIKNPDSLAIWTYAICNRSDESFELIRNRFSISSVRIKKALSHLEDLRLLRVTKTKQSGAVEATELLFFELPYEVKA